MRANFVWEKNNINGQRERERERERGERLLLACDVERERESVVAGRNKGGQEKKRY